MQYILLLLLAVIFTGCSWISWEPNQEEVKDPILTPTVLEEEQTSFVPMPPEKKDEAKEPVSENNVSSSMEEVDVPEEEKPRGPRELSSDEKELVGDFAGWIRAKDELVLLINNLALFKMGLPIEEPKGSVEEHYQRFITIADTLVIPDEYPNLKEAVRHHVEFFATALSGLSNESSPEELKAATGKLRILNDDMNVINAVLQEVKYH